MGLSSKDFKLSADGRTARPAKGPAVRGARVVKHGPDLNKTEQAFAEHLEHLRRLGRIARYYVKPFSLRLGPDRFYVPDFSAVRYEADEMDKLTIPRLVVIETEGFLRDDARDKFKEAVALWPDWHFLMIKKAKSGGGWNTYMRSEGAVDL